MKPRAGLWIDHRRAVIVTLAGDDETTRTIESNAEKQVRRAADSRQGGPFESQQVPADDSHQRRYTGELNRYYDEVAAHVRDAEAVLILGPGEAKGELKKRLERDLPGDRVVTAETADNMTEPQVAARVREHFAEPE